VWLCGTRPARGSVAAISGCHEDEEKTEAPARLSILARVYRPNNRVVKASCSGLRKRRRGILTREDAESPCVAARAREWQKGGNDSQREARLGQKRQDLFLTCRAAAMPRACSQEDYSVRIDLIEYNTVIKSDRGLGDHDYQRDA